MYSLQNLRDNGAESLHIFTNRYTKGGLKNILNNGEA